MDYALNSEKDISSMKTVVIRGGEDGEAHMLNPFTISKLQQAVREEKYETYKSYAEKINKQSEQFMTIRGLLKFEEFDPISIEEVEPWTEIVKDLKPEQCRTVQLVKKHMRT